MPITTKQAFAIAFKKADKMCPEKKLYKPKAKASKKKEAAPEAKAAPAWSGKRMRFDAPSTPKAPKMAKFYHSPAAKRMRSSMADAPDYSNTPAAKRMRASMDGAGKHSKKRTMGPHAKSLMAKLRKIDGGKKKRAKKAAAA